jgi:voltage-gated potassium channel
MNEQQDSGTHSTSLLRDAAMLPRRFSRKVSRKGIVSLVRFMLILIGLVVGFTVAFQLLMLYEGQRHSWMSGFYWTLTTMSTLGYGDITFTTDLGRLFSVIVLLSGIIFMLVLLPFTFIQFFYEPWIEARTESQAPRSVPDTMQGHVILTFYGPVANALISKLKQFNYPYVVVSPDLDDALRLSDDGIKVVFGALDDPETYRRVRVEHAALVATTQSDVVNTSVAVTVRGITETTPIVATAREEASEEVLKLAGCTRVLSLTALMAVALARLVIGGRTLTHVIAQIDDLLVAEIHARQTSLVGMTLQQAREATPISIVGLWTRGAFEVGEADTVIESSTVLVMAGSLVQLQSFEDSCQTEGVQGPAPPVVIIGGGRVGRATAVALQRRGIDYRIVERLPERIRDPEKYVLGSGADKSVLMAAGIDKAQTVIITTRDDETNIYLTIYARLLRPDIQIISRSSRERNVAPMHRAGSDFVMSYASMGANAFFSLLQRSDLVMIAEGLDVFKVQIPKQLAGKTLAESNIRPRTGCSVIGIDTKNKTTANPAADTILPSDGEIVLIGTPEAEIAFLKKFSN